MNVDFKRIRTIGGSQHQAFETLCKIVAMRSSQLPVNAVFTPLSPPDGGVEAFAATSTGEELGWQAKYYLSYSRNFQKAVEKSLKKACETHPAMRRYYVCAPFNLNDVSRRKWENAKSKWAADFAQNVEVVWWGEDEILEKLALSVNQGMRRFMFGQHEFTDCWFDNHQKGVVAAAWKRYSPHLHTAVGISDKLALFARHDSAIESIQLLARDIKESVRRFRYEKDTVDGFSDIIEKISQINVWFENLAEVHSPAEEMPLSEVLDMLSAIKESITDYLSRVADKMKKDGKPTSFMPDPLGRHEYGMRRLLGVIDDVHVHLKQTADIVNRKVFLMEGDAGVGKTHVLTHFLKTRLNDGLPTIMLLGQGFMSTDTPWRQICDQLDLSSDVRGEDVIDALEALAVHKNCKALIIIDALNEGRGREIWPAHLHAFLASLSKSTWINVVLSIRTPYKETVLPDKGEIVDAYGEYISHPGFADNVDDAIRVYCKHYHIEYPSVPALMPEFANPLHLYLTCEALKRKQVRKFPLGGQGMWHSINHYIAAQTEEILKQLEVDKTSECVNLAIDAIARAMLSRRMHCIKRQTASNAINELISDASATKVIDALIHHGILSGFQQDNREEHHRQEYYIHFAYEKIGDMLMAQILNDQYASSPNGIPISEKEQHLPYGHGVLEALATLLPEKAGVEIFDAFPKHQNRCIQAFISSIASRDKGAFSTATTRYLSVLLNQENDIMNSGIFNSLLQCSVMAEHPYNAKRLHKYLKNCTLGYRDAFWSRYLNYQNGEDSTIARKLTDWATNSPHADSMDDETRELYTTTVAWFFTTTCIPLRDKATHALVALLANHENIAVKLVQMFADVNDFYLAERVYAAIYGMAMKCHDASRLAPVAHAVYNAVFKGGTPPMHIMVRDYARGIIERAHYLDASLSINMDDVRPPYSSVLPKFDAEPILECYKDIKNGKVFHDHKYNDMQKKAEIKLLFSIMDWDFARYVIGTNYNLKPWLDIPLSAPSWAEKNGSSRADPRDPPRYDLPLIQQYIAWRVFDLGWHPELHGSYDSIRDEWPEQPDHLRTERIGKKYQWIAYQEYLAYLADNFQYYDSWDGDRAYHGSWQLTRLRNIDPSTSHRNAAPELPYGVLADTWWSRPLNNVLVGESLDSWAHDAKTLPCISDLLQLQKDGTEWVNFYADFTCQDFAPKAKLQEEVPQKHFYLRATGYFIRQTDVQTFIKWAKNINFQGRGGRGMPEHNEFSPSYLGEHGWRWGEKELPWKTPDKWGENFPSAPVKLRWRPI